MLFADAQSLRQRKRFTKGWSTVRNVSLQSGNVSSEGRACLPVLVIPFILHTGFMAATAFLVMHVQVGFPSVSLPLKCLVFVLLLYVKKMLDYYIADVWDALLVMFSWLGWYFLSLMLHSFPFSVSLPMIYSVSLFVALIFLLLVICHACSFGLSFCFQMLQIEMTLCVP